MPDVDSQREIADIISAYDQLIENNTRRIKILEEMAQSLHDEWFVRFRFPGHEKVKLVESRLGRVPEDWNVVPLQDVCLRITDGSHWSPDTVDVGLPMASVKDMHDWGFGEEFCRKISREDFEELVRNDCKPLKNDILIAKDGSYLKHSFAAPHDLELVILSSIAIVRPSSRVNPSWLAMYLKDSSVRNRLKAFVSGVALPRIVLKDFRKFQILLPPGAIQRAWFEKSAPMIGLCWSLTRKNSYLRLMRDLLLPKLISGEISLAQF